MKTGTVAAALLVVASTVGACKTPPPERPLQLTPEALEQRHLETRRFEAGEEPDLLRAALQILQDSEFQLDEMDADLGVVAGTRPSPPAFVSIVSRPVGDPQHAVAVRVTFHVPVWGHAKLPRVKDPVVYQTFFERLSRAVFLDARAL